MLALEKTSGLPLQLREDHSLVFGKGLVPVEPQAVDLSEIKNYLKNPRLRGQRRTIYWQYCGLALAADQEKLSRAGLRYDLLVMPPGKLGEEFVKTKGHYNSTADSSSYPQLVEILHGEAFLVLQRPTADPARLEELYRFVLKRGDKVVVPPDFGMVLVNPADEALVSGVWQAGANREESERYEAQAGGGYYVVESERLSKDGETSHNFEFVPNLNYKLLPKLQPARARELPRFDLRSALPMYFTGTRDPQSLDFLVNPRNYRDDLRPEKLFVLPHYEKLGH